MLRPVDIDGDDTTRRRTPPPVRRPDDGDGDEGSPARRRNAARTASNSHSILSGHDARDRPPITAAPPHNSPQTHIPRLSPSNS